MKYFISSFLILLGVVYTQNLNQNIDQFKINSFVRPVAKDSIEVLSFLEISNNALQFLKKDGEFEAQYEAGITILDSNNEKQSSELISDTINMASKNNIAKQVSDIGETDILTENLDSLDNAGAVKTDKKEENIEVNENNTSLTNKIK